MIVLPKKETNHGSKGRKLLQAGLPEGHDDSDLTDQIVSLLGRGEKIEAVKLYRDQSGCGLKEAKEAVERIGEQNGFRSSSGTGCLGVVLLGIVVAFGLLS